MPSAVDDALRRHALAHQTNFLTPGDEVSDVANRAGIDNMPYRITQRATGPNLSKLGYDCFLIRRSSA